jgi:hypothetical protein
MKKSMFLVIGMMLPIFSYAQSVEQEELEKICVEPSQIVFADQGIFAYVEGQWISVMQIRSDAYGGYIAYAKRKIHPTRWICECYYNNYAGDETCQRWDEISRRFCGKPRPW